MPIRRQYSELDKWRAFNHYISTGGFAKKTARECYLAVSTVRSWVKQWDFDPENPLQARNPPQQPTADELEEIAETGDRLDQYESLMQMALARLREVIPKTNSPDQLIRVFKELADRSDRAKGITDGGTPSTVNVNLRLAEAKAMGSDLMASIQRTLTDATERSQIIDVQAEEEPPQVGASSSETEVETHG